MSLQDEIDAVDTAIAGTGTAIVQKDTAIEGEVTAEATARESADTTEATARSEEDTSLQGQIDTINTTLGGKAPVATVSSAAPTGGNDGDVWYQV